MAVHVGSIQGKMLDIRLGHDDNWVIVVRLRNGNLADVVQTDEQLLELLVNLHPDTPREQHRANIAEARGKRGSAPQPAN